MKLFLLLVLCSFLSKPDAKFVLVDRSLKRPMVESNDYSPEQFRFRTFPIYASDLPALINAAEAAAKRLEQPLECGRTDTIEAGHSRILIVAECRPYQSRTIRIITRIDEQKLWCGFELVYQEDNNRKVQRQLLDFSTYLSR